MDDEWLAVAAEHPEEAARAELGRIVSIHYGGAFVRTEESILLVRPSGKLRQKLHGDAGAKPAVGDFCWVRAAQAEGEGMATGTLLAVLPRRTQLVRRAAGREDVPQVVVANVDVVLVCMAVGANFNLRRMQRFLLLALTGGATPVVVLTKSDLLEDDADAYLREAREAAEGADVLLLSSVNGEGLGALGSVLLPGKTAVMVGSSGVGKSTLLNTLSGQLQMLDGAVRERDDKGRHTTTHRELFVLPSGALLIDTPGLREVGIVGEEGETRMARRRKR